MKINKREFNKWIKALRSGKYAQAKHALQSNSGYCCLGVACKVLISSPALLLERRLFGGEPRDQSGAPEWLKMINDNFCDRAGDSLILLNDQRGYSFDEIADLLEAVYIYKVLD